jgi:hypothetical protein
MVDSWAGLTIPLPSDSCQRTPTDDSPGQAYPNIAGSVVMSSGREERNRFLGLPIGTGPRGRQGEEQQHVMGLPADLFESVNLDGLGFLAHPIRGYKRWARRRRLGPYTTDDDERLPIAYSVIRTGLSLV